MREILKPFIIIHISNVGIHLFYNIQARTAYYYSYDAWIDLGISTANSSFFLISQYGSEQKAVDTCLSIISYL